VGPLGVAGGYGIDERPLLEALERGVNYWYHGSLRGRGMSSAIRTLASSGRRDEIVVVLQSYSRWGWLLEQTFKSGLRRLGLDHADILLLGLFNSTPPTAIIEGAARLKEQGLVRHVAISAHRRAAFLEHASSELYDIFHIRYGAAHPGAEQDVFPNLAQQRRPGIVAYTATRWGQLLDPARMPAGQSPLRGRDCYRFVLGNPDFNLCMTGPRNATELREALAALDEGPLSPEEERHVRAIGQHVRGQRSLYQRIRAGRGTVLSGHS
jgi:aryl-alcohol dehydrogenase-like predicted oxidoreductase